MSEVNYFRKFLHAHLMGVGGNPAVMYVDTETRSHVDIAAGIGAYLGDAELLTVALRVHTELRGAVARTWQTPADLSEARCDLTAWTAKTLGDVDTLFIVGHNVNGFDRMILQTAPFVLADNSNSDVTFWDLFRPGLPKDVEIVWVDTASLARRAGLPSSLDKIWKSIRGREFGKHPEGARLIRQYCKPQPDGTFKSLTDNTRDAALMRDYCAIDCELVQKLAQGVLYLTGEHLDVSIEEAEINYKVNARGVMVDTSFVRDCVQFSEHLGTVLEQELSAVTEGEVTKATQVKRLKEWLQDWVRDNLDRDLQQRLSEATAQWGKLDQNARKACLNILSEQGAEDSRAYQALEILDSSGGGSLRKYASLLRSAPPMGSRLEPLRFQYVDAGASRTWRHSSRGVQLHNFNRNTPKPEECSDLRSDLWYRSYKKEPLRKLRERANDIGRAVRSALVPDIDNTFIVGDWTGIEARITPYLAAQFGGQRAAYDKLEAHINPDRDPYVETQEQLKLPDRQNGKVVELAFQFGGGEGALASMAAGYGLPPFKKPTYIVEAWRSANPWVQGFGKALEKDFWSCARGDYDCLHVGQKSGIEFVRLNDLYGGYSVHGVIMFTPECFGSVPITYALPSESDKTFRHYGGLGASGYQDRSLWLGLLLENLTQACAGHVLRNTMAEPWVSKHTVMHTHDELVLEVPYKDACAGVAALQDAMYYGSDCFPGELLKLDVEVATMDRYGK